MNIKELKSYHDGLANLKVGDTVFVATNVWPSGKNIELVEVTKVTEARITVYDRRYNKELIFTKDGRRYPRNQLGELMLKTPENTELFYYNKALNRVWNLKYEFGNISKDQLSGLSEMELRNLADVMKKYLDLMKPKKE